MKRLLILILLCFSLVLSADARMSLMQLTAGPSTAGPSCNISQQIEDQAPSNSQAVGATSVNYYASKFTYNGTTGKHICKMTLWMKKTGAPTDNYYVAIWGHNAGDYPEDDDVIGTSDPLLSSTVPTDANSPVTITFSTPTGPLSNGTDYWVVLSRPDVTNSDNILHWEQVNDAEPEPERTCWSNNSGASWTYLYALTGKYELISE